MRLDDAEESSNVEDRRGGRPGRAVAGGGIGLVIVAVIVMLMGGDPSKILGAAQGSGGMTRESSVGPGVDDEGKRFVSKILKETEDVWTDIFRKNGRTYAKPKLVLFTGQVESACGMADSAVGPFYCSGDNQVYIDLGFFKVMRDKLGAGGDFAQAYVIAHEVGHHIQNLLGRSSKVAKARQTSSETEANAMSVRLELQADFYAGVWAHFAKDLKIDGQDIEEALNAANAIGDDKLQKQAQGYVVPDSFTHGTSAQRMRWFTKGYESGDVKQGDTFATRSL